MNIIFQKYHGTGNDFILIDNMNGECDGLSIEEITHLCHRHFGIGSDGLILLRQTEGADYWMDFYNPDGSQSFCGNGSRCAFQFAYDLGYIKEKAQFKAIDGIHEAKLVDGNIAIKMNDVLTTEKIDQDDFIHTGSPHYIQYRSELDSIDIVPEAHKIRYNSRFKKEGTNVNYVKILDGGIQMRTYERGVENETLSCGTGVTAAALSYGLKNEVTSVDVSTQGGDLNVSFDRTVTGFINIWLNGPVKFVFEGKIKV